MDSWDILLIRYSWMMERVKTQVLRNNYAFDS